MKKSLLLCGIILCLPMMAVAQDHPKAEVFTGYSCLRGQFDANFNGWNVSVAGNLSKWFGVTGDFSGHYLSNGASLHLFLFGPKLTYRGKGRVNPYFQTMVGGAHANADFLDAPAFTWTAGGGVDVKINDRVAIRVFQADYVLNRFFEETQNNGRLSLQGSPPAPGLKQRPSSSPRASADPRSTATAPAATGASELCTSRSGRRLPQHDGNG